MKYIVLGSKGFIGHNIYKTLKKNYLNVIGLSRTDFDIVNPDDYNKFDFSDSTIIDCIASIDQGKSIFKVNVEGLNLFLNYLKNKHHNFQYIYFSTTSTTIREQVENNHYVKSKFLAERCIENILVDYKIIRLIFPFGKGESKNRLISRLIDKIKNGEQLKIDNVTLNITHILDLNNSFLKILGNELKSINFTDGKIYRLKELVDNIYDLLNIEKNYIFNQSILLRLEISDKVNIDDYTQIKNIIKDSYEL